MSRFHPRQSLYPLHIVIRPLVSPLPPQKTLISRLTLSGRVIEDDDSSAKYNISSAFSRSPSLKLIKVKTFRTPIDMTNRLLEWTGDVVDITTPNTPKNPSPFVFRPTWCQGSRTSAQIRLWFWSCAVAHQGRGAVGGGYCGFNNQYSGHFRHLHSLDLVMLSLDENWGVKCGGTMDRDAGTGGWESSIGIAIQLIYSNHPRNWLKWWKLRFPLYRIHLTPEEQDGPRNLGTKDCILSILSFLGGWWELLIENEKESKISHTIQAASSSQSQGR